LACLERRSYGEPALLKSKVEPGEGGQMPGKKYLTNANTTKEGFTGKERDKHSGLDYFGARYYDAAIGRFLSVDPLDFKFTDKNPFHYVSNNPINKIDPDGRSEIGAKTAAIVAVVVTKVKNSQKIANKKHQESAEIARRKGWRNHNGTADVNTGLFFPDFTGLRFPLFHVN
jgi:RHS repeat-associated protein